jgi:energy-coupling factor transporter transmembrane protein EcfT
MNFEYSYGLLGYLLKYFGGVVMLAMSLLFATLPFVMVSAKFYNSELFVFIGVLIISFGMILVCFKGAYYFLRYPGTFTKIYTFTDTSLEVRDSNRSDLYLFSNLEKIIYLKLPKVFELHFRGMNSEPIIFMNNGQKETKGFLELKNRLYSRKVGVQERIL